MFSKWYEVRGKRNFEKEDKREVWCSKMSINFIILLLASLNDNHMKKEEEMKQIKITKYYHMKKYNCLE